MFQSRNCYPEKQINRFLYLQRKKKMTHSNSSFALSPAYKVTNARRVQTLDCVDSNFSFASTNNDAKNFQRMLPDLKIAESYRQAETKAKYVL